MTRGASTRFRKGQSGNPKGRPRKVRSEQTSASAFDIVLDKTLTVTQNGVERELTVDEALLLRTYQDALAGNRPARRRILQMILRREEWLASQPSAHTPRPVIYRVEENPQNANAALLLLGIATRDDAGSVENDPYERLLLELWAVEAALRRGRNLHIADKDRTLLCNSTRGGNEVVWP